MVCLLFTSLQAVPIEFDVYLSYSEADKALVETIQDQLRAAKPGIRIFGEQQEIDKEVVWQQDMYQVMMRSARVVTGKERLTARRGWENTF